MRIGLNLLHALPEIGGGWNYIANLMTALGEHADASHSFVAFATEHSVGLVPDRPNFQKILINLQSTSRVRRVLFENTILPRLAAKHKLDCLHWFANVQAILNTIPAAVTVYDLQPYHGHASYSWAKRMFLRYMFIQAVRHAPMLLPMSEATATQLREFLQVDRSRMVVIPPLLEADFRPATTKPIDEFRARYRLPQEFWLYVAHFYDHKNHARLLQAYQHLKSSGAFPWPLVLRGNDNNGSPIIRDTLEELRLANDVIFLPQLPRPDLPILYSAASGLVFPSLYEGAGMPVIEAMACGCPVVCSDIAALREFVSDAGGYFEPTSVVAIGQAMREFQTDPERRQRFRRLGLVRAREFTAEPVISRLLTAYQQAGRSRWQGSDRYNEIGG